MRRKNEFAKASRERLFMRGFLFGATEQNDHGGCRMKNVDIFLKLTFFASNKTEFHRNI